MQYFKQKKGFMVVEVLVAVSIITASVLAALAVSQKSVYISRQSFHTTQASLLLEEGAEVVRVLRDNSWSNISSLVAGSMYYLDFSGGVWSASLNTNTNGIFTRTISILPVNRDASSDDIAISGVNDPNTKLATITISWNEGGTIVNKSLKFYIVNIFE